MAIVRGGRGLERALAQIAARLSRTGTLQVGFLGGKTYPDGTDVASVAFWNEYGTEHSPPRPFFRNGVERYSPGWPEQIAENLRDTEYDTDKTLDRMGHLIVDQIKQSIRDTNSPPLAESTVRRKGFDKPLIDTGVMIDSVAFSKK